MGFIFKYTDEDAADERANAEAGLYLRVRWVHKLRAELERLRDKYPQERDSIDALLSETREWL